MTRAGVTRLPEMKPSGCKQARSLLALPLLKQAELIGVPLSRKQPGVACVHAGADRGA